MTNILHREDPALESAIASAYSDLTKFGAQTEEYQSAVDNLSKLYKLKHDTAKLLLDAKLSDDQHQLEVDKFEHQLDADALPFYKRVDPNTVVTVAGNLLVAYAIIKYEQTGVITTKAMSFMRKI